jgi:hypothetical protein
MDIKNYIGKAAKIPTVKDNDIVTIFDNGKDGKRIEILCWSDDSSNYAALNLVVKNGVISDIYRERFCWMCPNGKCAEKRILKFPAAEAEKTAEIELKKLLAK